MNFGVTSKTSGYYLANLYQKSRAAGAANSPSFLSAVSAWERNYFPFERFFSDKAIVHPALEEKMKNDPEFAKKVMANIEDFIEDYQKYHAEPGCSYLIDLTEDGEIGKYCVTGPLRFSYSVSGSAQAEDYYKMHEEFERIAKEKVIKRKQQQQEILKEYYQSKIAKKAVSDA